MPQQPSIRTPPFLAFALFTPRPLYLCTAPSAPSRLPRFALSPLRFAPQPSPVFALHAPRLSRPSRFPLAENANRGPDCKENVPVWQKTSLGGLIRQGMRRPLDHIGKGPLLPRRKTAGQRIVHHELPQDSQNPSPATRPPSGVFCQMNLANPQCPLGSPSKQSDWRAFRVICPASFPNDLPGEFTQAVLHASHGHRQAKRPRAGGEFGNAYRNGFMMLAPPVRRRVTLSHADDPSHFPENLAPVFHVVGKSQRTKGTAMNDFSNKLGGKRGSGPLNPLPLR